MKFARYCLWPVLSRLSWRNVVKPDQINPVALAMFCDLEQIDHAQETRLTRQFWRDIRKPDRRDRSAQDRKTWQGRQNLSDPVSLHSAAEDAKERAKDSNEQISCAVGSSIHPGSL